MYSQTKETVTVVKTFKFTLKTVENDEKPASRLSTFYLNVNRTIGTDDFNECLSPIDLKNRSWTLFNKQISKYTVGVPEPIVAALDDSWTSRLIARNTHLLAPCDALDLVYIDQENDEIVIENSSDVAALLRLSQKWPKDAIHLHVYLSPAYLARLKEAQKTKSLSYESVEHSSSEGFLHQGIFCDCCNGQIRGFRYNCAQCSNYDLCSKCEAAGNHALHVMIRLPGPPFTCLPEVRRLMASQVPENLKQDTLPSSTMDNLSGLNLADQHTRSGRHPSTSDWTLVENQNMEKQPVSKIQNT